jgi:hypothetical protein
VARCLCGTVSVSWEFLQSRLAASFAELVLQLVEKNECSCRLKITMRLPAAMWNWPTRPWEYSTFGRCEIYHHPQCEYGEGKPPGITERSLKDSSNSWLISRASCMQISRKYRLTKQPAGTATVLMDWPAQVESRATPD